MTGSSMRSTGFSDVAADLGALSWGDALNLAENEVATRKAVQQIQIVAPSEAQPTIHDVWQAALDVIVHGRREKPCYRAELRLRFRSTFAVLGTDGVLTGGCVVGSLPDGFDGEAAIKAYESVAELHRAQDQGGIPDVKGEALADAAREALEGIDGLTPFG
ncbi:hypothetical protein [Streptomyces sp. NPDC002855]|uniref:hypothetical protein n=1 Tax=Streptomyces sp. NPDC002855 TaxID=3154437 RepID=UPI003333AFF0